MKILEMITLGVCVSLFATALNAQDEQPPVDRGNVQLYSISLRDAPLNLSLNMLQGLTGKDITVDIGLHATITLATPKVTAEEGIDLITRALNEQGIRLEDLDENTIRVRGVPKPRPESNRHESIIDESLKRRADYAERHRQRMIARQQPVDIPSGKELETHLQDDQIEVIREDLPSLDAQQAPDNIEIPKNEGVPVPAITIGEHSFKQSSENNTDNIE